MWMRVKTHSNIGDDDNVKKYDADDDDWCLIMTMWGIILRISHSQSLTTTQKSLSFTV